MKTAVILGKTFSKEELVTSSLLSKSMIKDYEQDNIDDWDIFDFIEEKAASHDIVLMFVDADEIDDVCIGIEADKLPNNKTLAAAKADALSKIQKLGLKAALNEIKFNAIVEDAGDEI